jgi:hypothetical protein
MMNRHYVAVSVASFIACVGDDPSLSGRPKDDAGIPVVSDAGAASDARLEVGDSGAAGSPDAGRPETGVADANVDRDDGGFANLVSGCKGTFSDPLTSALGEWGVTNSASLLDKVPPFCAFSGAGVTCALEATGTLTSQTYQHIFVNAPSTNPKTYYAFDIIVNTAPTRLMQIAGFAFSTHKTAAILLNGDDLSIASEAAIGARKTWSTLGPGKHTIKLLLGAGIAYGQVDARAALSVPLEKDTQTYVEQLGITERETGAKTVSITYSNLIIRYCP